MAKIKKPLLSNQETWKKFKEYKNSAKTRGIKFDLNYFQFKHRVQSPCYICGFYDPNKINGIDRVNNNVHYHIMNTASCCWTCNRAKNNLTLAEFKDWADRTGMKMKQFSEKELLSEAYTKKGCTSEKDMHRKVLEHYMDEIIEEAKKCAPNASDYDIKEHVRGLLEANIRFTEG